MTSDYKKYSLERLEEWMHDAMSVSEASPQEIYDVIMGVVKDNYYTYKHQASQAYELLALLNGNGESITKKHYEGWDNGIVSNRADASNLVCDKNDPSPECQKSWNDFWAADNQYTEEELNAMCDKAASDEEKDKCREYNLREAEYYDKRVKLDAKQDRVVKWRLPVEVDGPSVECFVTFPDDLLQAINLKEGDEVEWVDKGDGSYILRKTTRPLRMNEC